MLNKEIQIKKSKKRLPKSFYKFIFFLVLAGMLIAGQSYIFSAYEAHVINVTAKICRYSETRTIGFWKNHQEVYIQYLPQTLGEDPIITLDAADEIFQNAIAVDMSDMLRAQLLAMKFNIAHYGVGEYEVIGWGTINYIVSLADTALTPEYASREEMELIKNALDYINNLHRLSHCLDDIDPLTEAPFFVIQGAPEPSFFGEPFVAGASVEPPTEELPEPMCGDGIVEGEEECDDGNLDNEDSCSAICTIKLPVEPEPEPELPPEDETPPEPEPEPEPELTPICGDGIVNQETEQCDDGSEGSETCTPECTIIELLLDEPPIEEEPPVEEEPTPVCGDGVINQETEECDDGLEGSETCTPDCTIIEPELPPEGGTEPEPVCGDGVLEGEEECDDNNLEDGDGCSAICLIEIIE